MQQSTNLCDAIPRRSGLDYLDLIKTMSDCRCYQILSNLLPENITAQLQSQNKLHVLLLEISAENSLSTTIRPVM